MLPVQPNSQGLSGQSYIGKVGGIESAPILEFDSFTSARCVNLGLAVVAANSRIRPNVPRLADLLVQPRFCS
jgi:hypothetical protein